MVYDCFLFFNEFDLLEIRLNELKEVVDVFVACESTITFTGKKKPLWLTDQKSRFKDFNIQYLVYDRPPNTNNPWLNEHNQRNYLQRGLVKCDDSDIILLSDVDEIPESDFLGNFSGNGIWSLGMPLSYYYVNNVSDEVWGSAALTRFKTVKEMDMSTLRRALKLRTNGRDGGGNHFSYIGGREQIQLKLESFSHQELALVFNNPANIDKHLQDLTDLYNRKSKFVVVDLDRLRPCPKYLLKNRDKYTGLWLETKPETTQ
jgi:beta-1,4-mannosyl-glycoprotein beta-1,4-N-acetylglucosaminyltransferase